MVKKEIFCACMLMFSMYVYGMNLGRLMEENERQSGEQISPNVPEIRKSINDAFSENGQEENDESDQQKLNKIENQNTKSKNKLFQLLSKLFGR